MAKLVAIISTILFLQSCATYHIRAKDYYRVQENWAIDGADSRAHHPGYSGNSEFKEGKPNYTKTVYHYIWGIFGSPDIRMSQACGQKPMRQAFLAPNFGHMLVQVLTLGMVLPAKVEVWCGPTPA